MIRYMLLRGFFPPHAEESSKEYRKNWARLISKIYEVDPLTGPKCHGPIRVISFIEDQDVIKKILQRRTSPQAPWTVGGKAPTSTPHTQSAAHIHRALDRLFRLAVPPSDKGLITLP